MRARPFDTHGTEGMLDVVLACTLIFLLLTALVRIEQDEDQEVALPEIDLTTAHSAAGGSTDVQRVTISIANQGGLMQLSIDDRPTTPEELKRQLAALPPTTPVGIRRDRHVPGGWTDDILLACMDAGIRNTSFILAASPTPNGD